MKSSIHYVSSYFENNLWLCVCVFENLDKILSDRMNKRENKRMKQFSDRIYCLYLVSQIDACEQLTANLTFMGVVWFYHNKSHIFITNKLSYYNPFDDTRSCFIFFFFIYRIFFHFVHWLFSAFFSSHWARTFSESLIQATDCDPKIRWHQTFFHD